MNRFSSKVTIRDVARLAMVSTGTVSQALNGQAGVGTETRARVQVAAAKLGYRPHPSGRRLARRTTEAVGIILPAAGGALSAHVIRNGVLAGILEVATPAGYHLVLASPSEGTTPGALPRIVEEHGVDAVLTLCCDNPLVFHELARGEVPAVHIDTGGASGLEMAVDNDDTAGAYAGARHLLELGHRYIGLITARLDKPFGEAVFRGYERALLDAGIPLDWNLVQETRAERIESGYGAMSTLLERRSSLSAVFACSDYSALGALKALRAAGLHVPEDVAIVSMDDLEMSEHVVPSLTTLHVDYHTMGQRAMRLLLARLTSSSDEPPRQAIVPTLVVRDSCGARRTMVHGATQQRMAPTSHERGSPYDG